MKNVKFKILIVENVLDLYNKKVKFYLFILNYFSLKAVNWIIRLDENNNSKKIFSIIVNDILNTKENNNVNVFKKIIKLTRNYML